MLRHFFPSLAPYRNDSYWGLIFLALAVCGLLIYRRLTDLGGDRKRMGKLALFLVLTAGPLGDLSSRAVNMFYEPSEEWSLQLWLEGFVTKGTHTYHAAMVLPILAWIAYIKLAKLDFWLIFDVIMLYFPLGHAIGRVGCLAAGCCFGEHVDWHVAGMHYDYKNPVPLYAVIGNTALYLVLSRIFRRSYEGSAPTRRGGAVAGTYFVLYGLMRFCFELIRTEPVLVLGLTQAQLVMCAFMALGALLLVFGPRRRDAGAGSPVPA